MEVRRKKKNLSLNEGSKSLLTLIWGPCHDKVTVAAIENEVIVWIRNTVVTMQQYRLSGQLLSYSYDTIIHNTHKQQCSVEHQDHYMKSNFQTSIAQFSLLTFLQCSALHFGAVHSITLEWSSGALVIVWMLQVTRSLPPVACVGLLKTKMQTNSNQPSAFHNMSLGSTRSQSPNTNVSEIAKL